jgi:hypothetical protein
MMRRKEEAVAYKVMRIATMEENYCVQSKGGDRWDKKNRYR